jgi:hypothetical protein
VLPQPTHTTCAFAADNHRPPPPPPPLPLPPPPPPPQFDVVLLRRLLSMTGSLAKNIAMAAYAEQLGLALRDAAAAGAAGGGDSPLRPVLQDLDEALEIPRDLRGGVRQAALEAYMQQVGLNATTV